MPRPLVEEFPPSSNPSTQTGTSEQECQCENAETNRESRLCWWEADWFKRWEQMARAEK